MGLFDSKDSPLTDASFSDDGVYRWWLYRKLRPWATGPNVLWVLLNPSIANKEKNDPTSTRLIGFSEGFGFARYDLVNLWALVSTKPKLLKTHPDPVGSENDKIIGELAAKADTVIVAWGQSLPKGGEARAKQVLEILKQHQPNVWCLGTTKSGQPNHPLYLRADTKLEVYNWPS